MATEEELWLAARARMQPCVSAVFWQDFGIEGKAHDRAVEWILDGIFRPEFLGATDRPIWSVMRQDDNGNHFEVAHGLARTRAQEMVRQFEKSGHKQYYWILPKPDTETVVGRIPTS